MDMGYLIRQELFSLRLNKKPARRPDSEQRLEASLTHT
jgi:hypothetical protein